MNFRKFLKENIVFLDGGMGTVLQEMGLRIGEEPEKWNITHPDIIKNIHKDYLMSGSNVICANTFGANTLKFSEQQLEEIIKCSLENARQAIKECETKENKFVALDIGPLGRLLKPLGDLDFEDAVNIFKKTVELGLKYKVDLVLIETMNDSYETKAALLAVKESCDLPVLVSNAYSENGSLMTGASPLSMVALLEGMGADAIGVNCSYGPEQLQSVIDEYLKYASVPVIFKPNAGLPKEENGRTVFDVSAKEFSKQLKIAALKGARVLGGCCGTTPKHIKSLYELCKDLKPKDIESKNITVVSSYSNAVVFDKKCVLIGERINPTGKKRFKQALMENDIDYILEQGISQQQKGVHILDVNVGLPDIDEEQMLVNTVKALQSVSSMPLQIDTSNYSAMEKALRIYNGKPMINSVNGKIESMEKIFPLVKKYGGVVVALTLDEKGIPNDYTGRISVAKKILDSAQKFGIEKKDIIFDTLAMTISADNNAGVSTLKALKFIKDNLKCHTSLGISNVSFGLPNRDAVNSTFFAAALENGLSAAIMNPFSQMMMNTYYSYNAVKGLDNNCSQYIENVSCELTAEKQSIADNKINNNYSSQLQKAIITGFKDQSSKYTTELLKEEKPLDIVEKQIIPALDIVGKGYEKGEIFLPQLLLSAESAKSAFEEIKKVLPINSKKSGIKVVLATVKGDIHDIGKNIVKLIMENYGFNVIDLGKDVDPKVILDTVIKEKSPIAALSALMTTTVTYMEETITLIKQKAPWCKIIVGGAVLNETYAEKIGADYYAKDAMSAVRLAEEIKEN